MGQGITTGGGGGIHPGAPMIWPTSKEKVQQSQSSEEAQHARQDVSSTSSASSASSAAQASAAENAAAAAGATQTDEVQKPSTRQMSVTDLTSQLASLNLPLTEDNKLLASLMMQYGLEMSGENFEQLFKLMKGRTNQHTMESAIITLTKGLGQSNKSVDFLSQFLANQTQMTQNIDSLQKGMQALLAQVSSGKDMLNPSISAGIASVIGDLDTELKKLLKKAKDGDTKIPELKRGETVDDFKTFHQLLGGLEKQLKNVQSKDPKQAEVLKHQIDQVKKQVEDFLSMVASQAILSKESTRVHSDVKDQFMYWMFPNPFAHAASSLELLIKKDPTRKKVEINPKKTKFMMKMETETLGEMVAVVVVIDNKVWYVFNSEDEKTRKLVNSRQSDLKNQTESVRYQMAGFQSVKKRIDLRKYILPTLDLDSVKRIDAKV